MQKIRYFIENANEHFLCQDAGIGVVARAMIAREKRDMADLALCAMLERICGNTTIERAHD
jgi:hypothetical protein